MNLRDRIKQNEGYSRTPYKDTKVLWTIYYGHLIKPGEVFNGTDEEAEKTLDIDISNAREGLQNIFPDYEAFSQNRQDALVELLFNMGEWKIAHLFPRFVHNCNIQHWDDACAELKFADGKSILSKWYNDVHSKRAELILELLREG